MPLDIHPNRYELPIEVAPPSREKLADEIESSLKDGHNVVLEGEMMTGKTTLMRHLLHRFSGIYLSLEGVESAAGFIQELAGKLSRSKKSEAPVVVGIDEISLLKMFTSNERAQLIRYLTEKHQSREIVWIAAAHGPLEEINEGLAMLFQKEAQLDRLDFTPPHADLSQKA